jgi:hypothetical protein
MTAMAAADTPLASIVDEARRLLVLAAGAQVPVRLLGGVAIGLRVPEGAQPLLARAYQDIDLIIPGKRQAQISAVLEGAGYAADAEFNAFNGHRRLLFRDPVNERQVDVFVGSFSMCHEIPLGDRLLAASETLPPPELLLTKLQVVELNDKDLRDILNLLYHEEGLEMDRVGACCAGDWGLWRTSTMNLARARDALSELPLAPSDEAILRERIDALAAALESAPKTRRWRLRARVGDRVRWYEEPEEVA